MLPILVEMIIPLLVAAYLVMAHHRGRARRLWRDAVLIAAIVAGVALWQREVVYAPGENGVGGYGIHLWPWAALAVLAATLVIQLLAHPRVPRVVRLLPAALASAVVLAFGSWIS